MRILTLEEALEGIDVKYIYATGNEIAIVKKGFAKTITLEIINKFEEELKKGDEE